LFAALAVLAAVGPGSAWAQGGQGQPVQMPLQVQVTPAPSGPVVTWQPVAGANTYSLLRWKRTGGQGRCCQREMRSLGGTRYVDTTIVEEGTYIYRLIAHLGNGRRGYQERTVQIAGQASQARNPSSFTAVQTGPGTVALSWTAVPRSLFYQLNGPGTGPDGLRVGGTTQLLTGLAEGRQEWQLVTLYPPGTRPDWGNPSRAGLVVAAGPRPQDVAAGPTGAAGGGNAGSATEPGTSRGAGSGGRPENELATIAPPTRDLPQRARPEATAPVMPAAGPEPAAVPGQPVVQDQQGGGRGLRPMPVAPKASARYLVTVTGLRTGYTTKDGIGLIDVDGKGDEIMAAAFVRRYDRSTAQPLETTSLQTEVYGDVHGYGNERVQAGRLTSTGGITDGDAIPGDASVARAMAAQQSVFPWKLWEGTLTEGTDAVVISPSIWEFDGNPVDFHAWNQNQQQLSKTIFLAAKLQEQIDARRFEPLVLGANETPTNRFDGTMGFLLEGGIGAVMGLPPLVSILGRQRDRPIGLVASGQNATALPNTTVVLTREIIEAALATPPRGVVNPMPFIIVPMVKPGLMVINFEDRTLASTNTPVDMLFDRKAFYSMILQVERVSE
jgi:hypothetical protein